MHSSLDYMIIVKLKYKDLATIFMLLSWRLTILKPKATGIRLMGSVGG